MPDEREKDSRPARPAIQGHPRPPIQRSGATGIVRTIRSFLVLSFVLGGITIAFAAVNRTTQVEELRSAIADSIPTMAAETRDIVSAALYLGTLASLAVIVLVEALLLRAIIRRRRGARWGLLVAVIVHLAIAVATVGTVGSGDGGIPIIGLLTAQFCAACAGAVIGVLPATRRWILGEDELDSPLPG
jgi:membrane protease YdiL (CAAX protease family)